MLAFVYGRILTNLRMSKYLIKPTGSIWLNPPAIYDLKRDLLLYDKVGMLNVDNLIEGLFQYKQYPVFRNTLNEIEFLVKNELFIELKQLAVPFSNSGTALINKDDLGLADMTMKLKSAMQDEKDTDKRDELYWKHDILNTRLWCNIINDNNESVFTVPSLIDTSTFEISGTTKQKVYSIIHKLIPLPSNETPWEKIIDFRNDEDSKLKLLALKNWINELHDGVKANELEDKINYLFSQYSESLRRHKINSRLSTFKTIVNAVPTALTEIIRLRFGKAIDAFFSIAEQEVNFTKFNERNSLKGNELAYISHTKSKFK
ncbi:hypothetical protein [Sphingobacterium sp. IITKGP-BTPF85]|uniref:hypothetical protein n=1 Tax=Sphingobacterium sp. IITKGP-BTPF85 TaxID=1338009 RepID=UPI0012E09148|nr:hypothetical protein [Sphingobacterium sp. IITKGP-BTPF85]